MKLDLGFIDSKYLLLFSWLVPLSINFYILFIQYNEFLINSFTHIHPGTLFIHITLPHALSFFMIENFISCHVFWSLFPHPQYLTDTPHLYTYLAPCHFFLSFLRKQTSKQNTPNKPEFFKKISLIKYLLHITFHFTAKDFFLSLY